MYEDKIIEVLKDDDASAECKNYLCRDISWMGTEKSVPVLNDLLKNDETSEMAKYALTRMK